MRDDELEYIESEPAGELPPLSAQHLSYTLTVSHMYIAAHTHTHTHTNTVERWDHALTLALSFHQ